MSDQDAQRDTQQSFARKSVERLEDLSRKPYVEGLPEWNMFPDETSRRAAIREIERGMMPRSIKDVLGFIVAVILFLSGPFIIAHLVTTYVIPPMGRWNDRFMLALALLGYTVVVYLALRRNMPKALRKQLIKAGVPVCLKCGYDLRGLPGDRTQCPECGREFDEKVAELVRNSASRDDGAKA